MKSLTAILNKFWPAKIRPRLILGISLVPLGLMTIFVFDLVNRQKQFLKKENHQQLESFAGNYAINSKAYIIANDFEGLQRLTQSYSNFPNLRYAMVLSPEGVILAHTKTQYIGKIVSDSVSLTFKSEAKIKTLIENDDVADLAAPIVADGKIVGWSRAAISQDSINQNLSDIIRNGFWYIFIALVAGSFIAVFIGNKLSNGLYRLISVADKIKAGNRNVRVGGFRNFELGELGIAINQMLDKISANEKLLNMVIENLPVGLWILGKNGEILSGNPAGKQLWGGSFSKDAGRTGVYQGWTTENGKLIEPLQSAINRAIEKGETIINEELEIETFDKRSRFILNSAIPLIDNGDEIIGAIAIHVDITERKRITEKLALSESTLSGAFGYSAIGMAIVSLEGRFMKVNSALCKMVGYSEKEFVELNIKDITYPETISNDIDFLEKAGKGQSETYRTEKRYYHKDGSIIWINLNVSLVKDNQGCPLYFVSQIEDISEKKKISEQLKEKESLLRIFIQHSPAALAMFDNEMKYLQVSQRWLTDYNLKEEDIIGKSHYEVFPTVTASWKKIHQKCLAGAIEKCEEDSFIREDGSVNWLQWEIHPWRVASGAIGGIIMLTEVITERKESELKFKNLVENALIGVYILQNGRFAYVNPRFAKDLDYTPGEMIAMTDARQIVYAADIPVAEEQWRKRAEDGVIDIHVELRYQKKNGEIIWAEVNSSETLYKGARAVIGTFQDITDRKNAEAVIKEQAETFGAIIENTNESIILLSPDLKVLQFNKTTRDRLYKNFGKEIYTGADFGKLLYPGSEDIFYLMFNEALSGKYTESEVLQTVVGGNSFWLRTRMYPI
ncbi:MAG: PAS domain S-box protein, partial [Bacteroidota bacterium]